MGSLELGRRERAMFLFPLSDCSQTVTDEKRLPGGRSHPGRDAESLLGRSDEDLRMYVGINGDRQLWRRLPTRHTCTLLLPYYCERGMPTWPLSRSLFVG